MNRDGAHRRIHELDAARGFALCGILVVDIWQLTDMRATIGPGTVDPARHVLSVLFEGRFFPIFSFLFGLSFSLFLDRAAQLTARPRVVLVRRLVALGIFGLIHHVFRPGEALFPYAIVGLVILLPASGLPRWVLLLAGLVGTIGVAVALGGGLGLVPGLFLLGFAADRFGLADNLREHGWWLAVVFALALPAALVAGVWEYRTPYTNLWTGSAAPVAGLLGALAYLTGLLLFLRTETGELFAEVLEPMGRMALTNYVSATTLILAADPWLGLSDSNHYGTLLGLAAAIIAVQATVSYYWLRWLRYGPLEWVWRCVTWWQLVPNRLTRQQRWELSQPYGRSR
ncbi:DUF418 domain-containing protein [Nocardia sp. NBC_00565]|uniref:DUF418 domain-containing protein n=1 Tax=Nocardia sp. NBC_00565 TaxID=2975993 RepID=UPI002E817FE5|nr:DUF418 domain-containing protein [Nocardia sp. NBC_00565]WUC03206.1 DUF418 domain-containing protein [Nocardia sp. NBC_00565]